MRMWIQSLALLSGLRIQHCRELWCRLQTEIGSQVAVLWLWCWPATTAPFRPLAWEPPYATGAALKKKRPKKKKQKPVFFIWNLHSFSLLSGRFWQMYWEAEDKRELEKERENRNKNSLSLCRLYLCWGTPLNFSPAMYNSAIAITSSSHWA